MGGTDGDGIALGLFALTLVRHAARFRPRRFNAAALKPSKQMMGDDHRR